jgi:transposase
MDMSAAYRKAVQEAVPHAQIVYDRYHVQALVNKAVDKTRREEWRRIREEYGDKSEEAKAVKNLRWLLLKNPWNLTRKQKNRVSSLQQQNERVYRAYLLKEEFAAILDRRQPGVAETRMRQWLSWASRSRLPAFVKAARTIRKHLEDILAYIRWDRVSNGLPEGLNNKARLLTRRAYGFHSAEAAIAMIMLCCSGLQLQPVHKALDW